MKALFNLLFPSQSHHPLPPSPPKFPLIGNLLLLRKSSFQLEPTLRDLHAKYGPIVTLFIGSQPSIFISDRFLAHQALVQNGALFSGRPKALPTIKILTTNQFTINSAFYGPTWRLLRRNLTSEMLHPNRIKSFSETRRRVLDSLLNSLKFELESGNSIKVIDHLQYAMFCVLASMCLGKDLDEKQLKDIDDVRNHVVGNIRKFNFLNIWPLVTQIWFRKSWEELFQIRKKQEDVLIPMIRLRRKSME